uniref:Replication factor A C-terminal domain-containing protein n=1 Tax=Brassica oleracea TaxID=3712 RepID=A0A3P6DYP4_BRAOL|nr:unnamed protein product [Brassica oleracea]
MVICVIRLCSVLTPYLAGIIQPISCSTQHSILLRSSKQVSLMIHLLLRTTIVANGLLVLLLLFVPGFLFLIGEIIDSSVGTFVTLGTIETIDTERGWQYLKHSDVISRFKLIANVKDDSGEANFLLFDANAQAIVRHSAVELYDENED